MRQIPFSGGAVILSGEEKVSLAKQIVKGCFAQRALEATVETVENTTKLGSALAIALDSAIEYLQAQDDPAAQALLDQIHAVLSGTFQDCYGEEALSSL